MRKVIIKTSAQYSMDDWANVIKNYNSLGIDPVFIPADHEIMKPEKKRKKVRPVRKKRDRRYFPLSDRFIGADIENLGFKLGV